MKCLLITLPLFSALFHFPLLISSSFVTPQKSSSSYGRQPSLTTTFALFEESSTGGPTNRAQQGQQQQQQQEQQHVRPPLQPVVIVDDNSRSAEVRAATLALQTLEVLKGHVQIPPAAKNEAASPPPPSLAVYTVDSTTNLQTLLNSQRQQAQQQRTVVLHVPVPIDASGGGGTASSANNIVTPVELLQQASFVGLHIYCTGGDDNNISLDSAQSAGTALQQIISSLPSQQGTAADSSPPMAVVSLDLELHLALLRLNALPKDNDPAHGDSYQVFMPEDGSSLLVDYFYDHSNPFGGNDPLSCPSKQILIETPPTSPSLQRNRQLAAAYTALRGQTSQTNNVPAAATSCAAIAASVATILGDDDNVSSSSSSDVSWNMIERAAQLSNHIRDFGSKQQDPGFLRQQYIAYGYK